MLVILICGSIGISLLGLERRERSSQRATRAPPPADTGTSKDATPVVRESVLAMLASLQQYRELGERELAEAQLEELRRFLSAHGQATTPVCEHVVGTFAGRLCQSRGEEAFYLDLTTLVAWAAGHGLDPEGATAKAVATLFERGVPEEIEAGGPLGDAECKAIVPLLEAIAESAVFDEALAGTLLASSWTERSEIVARVVFRLVGMRWPRLVGESHRAHLRKSDDPTILNAAARALAMDGDLGELMAIVLQRPSTCAPAVLAGVATASTEPSWLDVLDTVRDTVDAKKRGDFHWYFGVSLSYGGWGRACIAKGTTVEELAEVVVQRMSRAAPTDLEKRSKDWLRAVTEASAEAKTTATMERSRYERLVADLQLAARVAYQRKRRTADGVVAVLATVVRDVGPYFDTVAEVSALPGRAGGMLDSVVGCQVLYRRELLRDGVGRVKMSQLLRQVLTTCDDPGFATLTLETAIRVRAVELCPEMDAILGRYRDMFGRQDAYPYGEFLKKAERLRELE